MSAIKVQNWTVHRSELEGTKLAEAQEKFKHIDKRIVKKAWDIVNPETETTQEKEPSEKGRTKEK